MTLTANLSIRESDLVEQPDKDKPNAKAFTVTNRLITGGAWLSILPDGSLSASDDIGEYQLCYRRGDDGRVFWECLSQYPTGSYGLPLAVGL